MTYNQESPSKELEQKGDLGDKLLDCPFCDSPAELYARTSNVPNFNNDFIDAMWVADCTECNANIELETSQKEAVEAWNTRAPSKDKDPEGLIHSYVASRKLANKMNVAVTLHYEGKDYTVKPMRLGEKVEKLKEQLTATQTLIAKIYLEAQKTRDIDDIINLIEEWEQVSKTDTIETAVKLTATQQALDEALVENARYKKKKDDEQVVRECLFRDFTKATKLCAEKQQALDSAVEALKEYVEAEHIRVNPNTNYKPGYQLHVYTSTWVKAKSALATINKE